MITPAKIRAIRAYLGETQQQFASRFKTTRYTVIYWERFGIVDRPDLERLMLDQEPAHDAGAATDPVSRKRLE